MSKELYGLIDPSANKFIVVSTNFSAIKKVQFTIMQKYFFPVVNITKAIEYQKKYNTEYKDIISDEIDNTNCMKFGVNTTMIQSIEQTLSMHQARSAGIFMSSTDIDISYELKEILEIILEIYEIIDIQIASIKKFKAESTKDRDNGIKEFFNFLKMMSNTENNSDIKKLFEQEMNLEDRYDKEIDAYQTNIIKILVDSINHTDISKDGSVAEFINDSESKISKTKNMLSPRFPYFLLEDGFDKLSSFKRNPNLYNDLLVHHGLLDQIAEFLRNRLNENSSS